MLNLNKYYQYSVEELDHIQEYLSDGGNEAWENSRKKSKKIRNELSRFTIINQGGKCAYCELRLRKGATHLEHFIPKTVCPKFTYEPRNLFSTCSSCNAPGVKSAKGIILEPPNNNVYEMNVFKILHPLFHNPDEHIKYTDDTRVFFDYKKCSDLGIATINFFGWRSKTSQLDRLDRFDQSKRPIDIMELVEEIATYR